MSTSKKTSSGRKKGPAKSKSTGKAEVKSGAMGEVIEGVAVEVTEEAASETQPDIPKEAAPEESVPSEAKEEAAQSAKQPEETPADPAGDAPDSADTPESSGEHTEDFIEVVEDIDHSGRAGWYAAGALACFIGGAGAFAYAAPWLSQNLPESLAKYVRPAGEAVDTRLSALENSVASLGTPAPAPSSDLAGRLDGLERKLEALNTSPSSAQPSGLSEQVSALEAAVARNAEAAMAVDITPVLARLEQIETALKDATETGGGSAAKLAAISAEVAALSAQVKDMGPKIAASLEDMVAVTDQKTTALTARLEVLENDDRGKAASRAISLAALSSAVERGNFSAELQTYKSLAPDAMATPALDGLAAAGLPDIPGLQAGYQEALQIALKSEHSPGKDASWSDKLFGNAMSVVTVRPVGEVSGTSTSAILARGEVRVQAGNITAALDELDGLSGSAREAMAEWVSSAGARTAALVELDKLKQSSLAAMSGATN